MTYNHYNLQMTITHPYHLDPFYSNRLFSFKVIFLNTTSRFWKYISLNLNSFRVGIISGLYKDLGKMFLMVEGLKGILNSIEDLSMAKEEYIYAEKALIKFRKYYYLLEDVDFLNHEGIKDISSKILLDLYEIESKLKFLSFDNPKDIDSDKELRQAASLISINTMNNLHAI
jgi:hypothetical protein